MQQRSALQNNQTAAGDAGKWRIQLKEISGAADSERDLHVLLPLRFFFSDDVEIGEIKVKGDRCYDLNCRERLVS